MKKTAEEIYLGLKDRVKGNVTSNRIIRTLYATDASMFKMMPSLVVEPCDESDVREVVLYAKEHNIPIACRGGGTGLAGESLTAGIVLDFSVHMNSIKEINWNKNFCFRRGDTWNRRGVKNGNLQSC